MGRSVSTPRNALTVAYTTFEVEPMECICVLEGDDECMCGASHEEHDPWFLQDEWSGFTEDLTDRICELLPSFSPEDGWAGREDRILAGSKLVTFGVSEYCGCVAIWLAARDGLEDDNLLSFAEAWVNQVSKKFDKEFGTMHRIGVLGDGTSYYHRGAA